MHTSPADVVRRVVDELFNQHRLELIEELYWPDAHGGGQQGVPEFGSIPDMDSCEQMRQTLTAYRALFPDHQYTLHEMLTDGDKAAFRWSVSGTRVGAHDGDAEREQPFHVEGISIVECRDGRIARIWQQFDLAGLAAQTGVDLVGLAG